MTDAPRGSDDYPTVPHDRLVEAGWERRSRSEETVFRVGAASVVGYTLFYNDSRLREAVEAVGAGGALTGPTDGDRVVETGDEGEGGPWRFFFATRLAFQPPLAPGIGTASVRPTVASQARRTFADDLEARGFEAVESGRRQRLRTESGERAQLRKFTAVLPLDGEAVDRLDVEGWLAVWATGGSFRVAGGAYPVAGLDAVLEPLSAAETPTTDPGTLREGLLDAIRAVR